MRQLECQELSVVNGAALPFGGIIAGDFVDMIKGSVVWGVVATTLGSWIGIKWTGLSGGPLFATTIAMGIGLVIGGLAGGFLGFVGGGIVGYDKAYEYYNEWLAPVFGGNGPNSGTWG